MDDEKVSSWQKASTIANFLEVATVSVSLIIIICQIRQQTKLTQAANTQSLVNLITPLNLKITDRELAELWVKGEEGIAQLPDEKERDIQEQRYGQLVASYLIFYEMVYSQNKAGMVEPQIYAGWDKDLSNFIKAHEIDKYWAEWKSAYREDFSAHVDEIIRDEKAKASPSPTPSPTRTSSP